MGEAAAEIGATFDDGVDEPIQPVAEAPKEAENVEIPPVQPVAEEAPTEEAPKEEAEDENAKAIRDAAFKAREAKREAAEAKRQLEEAQRKLQEYEAPVRPDIPPPPDPYDDNFAQKVAHRDALIAQAARWDQQQAFVQQQAQQAKQEEFNRQQEKLRETVTAYSGTAEKLGIAAHELQQAGMTVAQYGINDDIANHILTDELGPSITVYLAKNPLEMDKLSVMSPIKAAAYIEANIKPKARKPPPTLAPEPIPSLKGSGMPEKDDTFGATFE